jgi:hypothetical protein
MGGATRPVGPPPARQATSSGVLLVGRMAPALVRPPLSRELLAGVLGNSYHHCIWGCNEGLGGESGRIRDARS